MKCTKDYIQFNCQNIQFKSDRHIETTYLQNIEDEHCSMQYLQCCRYCIGAFNFIGPFARTVLGM